MTFTDVCGLYFTTPTDPPSWRQQRNYLPQLKLDSHTTISSTCYTTALQQTFSNASDDPISQARYTFPLYDGVAVNGYTIKFGGKTLKGIVQQKNVAKQTYQTAVDKGETAGLLESLPAGVFDVTLGNIPAKTDVHVEIVYGGELKHDAAIDGLRYMLPTSIAPRYGEYPGTLLKSTAVSTGGISITVDVDMDKSAIRKVQSPSHPIAVSMGATSAEATDSAFNPSKASTTLTLGTTELAGDFVLQLLIDDISKPQAVIEKHPRLPSRTIMTTLVPRFNLETMLPEIVFIADQSGSMGGKKNVALVSALKVFLKSLPVGVRFNICAFGNSHKFLWPKSQAYNEDNMETAIRFVESFKANYGGTELLNPVKTAFEQRLGDLPIEIMLLTDGEIWGERELFAYINTQICSGVDARLFALGIGRDVSHTLVEGVARAGNGFSQFVTQDEETDQKVVRMLKAALYPHTKDYSLEIKYGRDSSNDAKSDDDDFELVEKVDYCLNIEDATTAASPEMSKAAMSFFNSSADIDKPIKSDSTDRYAHLPDIDPPKVLQAPTNIPPLFPFNRTTLYLILGPDAPQKPVSSATLRATSPQGPLELTIPINETEVVGTTVHQLAARKAVQELEEGRGWLQTAKTREGLLAKDKHASRFDELVEREAVRLGERFQVAGKWTSFVAVEDNDDGSAHHATEQAAPQPPSPSVRRKRGAAPGLRGGGSSLMSTMSTPGLGAEQPPVFNQMQMPAAFPRRAAAAPSFSARLMGAFGGAPASAPFEQKRKSKATNPSVASHASIVQSEEAESSDDDMGYALLDVDRIEAVGGERERVDDSEATMHSLIRLQKFSGAWEWSDELFAVMGCSKDALADVSVSEVVKATALVVAFFETNLAERRDVWVMVIEKARQWLGAQVSSGVVDELVAKGKKFFEMGG